MNNNKLFLCAALFCLSAGMVQAQDCHVPIAIHVDGRNIPQEAMRALENTLTRIATASDYEADLGLSQFVLTARVDALEKSFHAGPPMQIIQNMGITFFVADTHSKTKFASTYIEMDGVGQNETKCYIDAFKHINGNQQQIQSLLRTGRQKILAYYDSNYQTILREAEKQASLQKYDAAIALAISIPTCSNGAEAGLMAGRRYYAVYRDKYNLGILNRARMTWATSQDANAAREAGALLAQIDSEAACYKEALTLATEIKTQVRSDLNFQMREKYHDQIKIQQMEIEAMKAIGVAYGKGQKPITTNLMWLR